MKKAIVLGWIVWLCSLANAKGQASLGIDSTIYTYTNPVTFNSTDTFAFVLMNTGPQTYSGTVHIAVGVDTNANGTFSNLQIIQDDSGFVNMLPGDTLGMHEAVMIAPAYFRHGINTVVIWPRAMGSANFTTADSLILPLLVDTTAGIDHYMSLILNAKMFPNPASQYVYVALCDPNMGIERVRYLTAEGRLLKEEKFTGKLDVSDLAAGAYLIELIGTKGTAARYRIMKE